MKLFKILLAVLFLGSMAFALETGSLNGPMPTVKGKAPVHSSKYFVVTSELQDGKAAFNIPVSVSNPIIVLMGAQSDKVVMDGELSLMSKAYNTPELEHMEIPGLGTKVEVSDIRKGFHTISFVCKETKAGTVNLVVAEPESPVELKVSVTPLSVKVGDSVIITADLGKEVSPVKTFVKAIIKGDTEIELRDDGQYPDEVMGDGIFSGSIIADTDKAFDSKMVKIQVVGVTKDNVPFMRDASASFMVTSPTVYVDGVISDNGNSITVPLSSAEGRYRVEVIYGHGENALAYVRDDIVLDGSAKQVVLPRPTQALAADRAVVRVLNMDTLGVEVDTEIPVVNLGDFNEEKYRMKSVNENILPESKKKAAELYGDKRPDSAVK